MLKYILIILSLVPAHVHAHQWDADYWLERIVRNHNKTIDCLFLVQDNHIDEFRSTCSTWVLAYTENNLMTEYYAEWDEHPEQTEPEFIFEHFEEDLIVPLAQNLLIQEQLEAIIVSLFIVEGLTRDVGTKHITEGQTSTDDEGTSDD